MLTDTQLQASEQFAEDYILVTENDGDTYQEILDMPETIAHNMSGLSDRLRDEFETYISQVADRERESGNTTGALLISQLLTGWGTTSFDKIAKHYLELKTGE